MTSVKYIILEELEKELVTLLSPKPESAVFLFSFLPKKEMEHFLIPSKWEVNGNIYLLTDFLIFNFG
jgi:hypothetical protein